MSKWLTRYKEQFAVTDEKGDEMTHRRFDTTDKSQKTDLLAVLAVSPIGPLQYFPSSFVNQKCLYDPPDTTDKRSGEVVKTFVDLARMVGVDNGILLDEVVILGELDAPEELLQCSRPELTAWATAIGQRLVRERGLVPNDWTKVSHCKYCGPVWSFHDLDTLSCGWCEVRRAGRFFPVPV